MTDKEFSEVLDHNDREFISMFFNTIPKFQIPRNKENIDAHLSVNIHDFFKLCDLIYEHKSMYIDLRRKFILGEMGKDERFYIF